MSNDKKEIKKRVEAVLFASSDPLEMPKLQKLSEVKKPKEIIEAINQINKDLRERESALTIIELDKGFKFTVREPYIPLIRGMVENLEINKPVMETLAVIAWKSPVIQTEVIKIRGASAYEHIKELVDTEFIIKTKQGRSYILKIADKFFTYFNVPKTKEAVKNIFKIFEEKGINQQKIEDFEEENYGDNENEDKKNVSD